MTTQLIFLAVAVLIFIILQIGVIWYLRYRVTKKIHSNAKKKADLIEKFAERDLK